MPTPLEDRYLNNLAEQQFPTVTPVPEIKATPRNEAVGAVADFVGKVRELANQYEIKDWVPLLGGMGVGDLLVGKSPEEIENWAYGNAPMRIPEMSNVPVVKTGRKESLADTMMLGVDVAPAAAAAKAVGKSVKKSRAAVAAGAAAPAAAGDKEQ